MDILHAVIFGIIQGLTEFLPISSTGHLRIIPALLGWGNPGAAFTAVIQFGTLVAVLFYFQEGYCIHCHRGNEGDRHTEVLPQP